MERKSSAKLIADIEGLVEGSNTLIGTLIQLSRQATPEPPTPMPRAKGMPSQRTKSNRRCRRG